MLFNLVLLKQTSKNQGWFCLDPANIPTHTESHSNVFSSQRKDKVTSIIMRNSRRGPWHGFLAFMAFVAAWICVLGPNGNAFGLLPRLSIVLVTSPIPSHPSTQLVDPWKFEKGLLFGNEDPFIPPKCWLTVWWFLKMLSTQQSLTLNHPTHLTTTGVAIIIINPISFGVAVPLLYVSFVIRTAF